MSAGWISAADASVHTSDNASSLLMLDMSGRADSHRRAVAEQSRAFTKHSRFVALHNEMLRRI
jgi:hypothetical protein